MGETKTMSDTIRMAKRLDDIPTYLFQRIDDLIAKARAKGIEVISLGIGDPDLPTSPELVDELYKYAQMNRMQKYPAYKGIDEFRQAVAGFYQRRFAVDLDPEKETLALIGSKEGIANLALAVLDPEDIVLYPDPCYPVYPMHAVFAGCDSEPVPLKRENNFLIDFGSIPDEICRRAKLLWMNYPNNPTSALAPVEFFDEAVAWAKKCGVILAHDNPYSEIYQSDTPPPSILNAKGAMDVAIEFNSLSKAFNMTGWRVGMAVGNPDIVQVLGRVKSNIDSGVFLPIQHVAIKALNYPLENNEPLRAKYAERRIAAEEVLEKAKYDVYHGQGTFYVWAKTPNGMGSLEFVEEVINETGVVFGPGSGWGKQGEGFFRVCLTREADEIRELLGKVVEKFKVK